MDARWTRSFCEFRVGQIEPMTLWKHRRIRGSDQVRHKGHNRTKGKYGTRETPRRRLPNSPPSQAANLETAATGRCLGGGLRPLSAGTEGVQISARQKADSNLCRRTFTLASYHYRMKNRPQVTRGRVALRHQGACLARRMGNAGKEPRHGERGSGSFPAINPSRRAASLSSERGCRGQRPLTAAISLHIHQRN
jgi:hypothetical protein